MLPTLLLTLLLSPMLAPPQEPPRPEGERTPEWLNDPAGWPGFALEEDDVLVTRARGHVERWRLYQQLEITPFSAGEDFRRQLAAALQREAVYIRDVPPHAVGVNRPLPTVPAMAPAGPMDEALINSLAAAVQDAWMVLEDRPFQDQRERYFAGRVVRLDRPDLDVPIIEHLLEEEVDPESLDEPAIWQYLERLYEKRRAAFNGDFNLSGAALGSSRGIGCQIFYSTPTATFSSGLLMVTGNPAGTGWDDYWKVGLMVCARQFTHPPVNSGKLRAREGRVLQADVQAILELKNGERAPMVMSLFYDPQEEKWWVTSFCFTSSPYVAMVGQVR